MDNKNTTNCEINRNYTNELSDLIDLAYSKFGNSYFEKLEELSIAGDTDSDPNYYRYSLITTHAGAFNAR